MGKWEDYEVMKLLGKGSFGSVYSVRKISDRSLHVLKKISIHNMPAKERKATEVECKVLERLRHPGIVCYEDSFIHKNRNLCIIMSFCEGGDLATVIEKRRMRHFPENEVVNWFLQIGLAIQYMHEAHILHRDIKTQNIFLTKDNMIKVGDFGIAKVLEGTLEMAKTVIGTPYYMSPELFRNQPYSYKSDIWSLGCVLFELMALRHAFEARDMNGLVQKIFRGSHAPIPAKATKDMRDLIKAMLSISPGGRPSMSEILSKPFLRKEMSTYIQNSLGDEGVAAFIRDDPKLMGYHRVEQDHLEKQARKLGFDVKKDTGGSSDNVVDSRPSRDPSKEAGKVDPKAQPQLEVKRPPQEQRKPEKPALDPAKVEAERREAERKRLEEKEQDRQRRAQAFLEKELRAKERAEAALKQLQKEKMEKMKKLQEERERRQKRMQQVHPKGEAALVGEWQQRLANARAQHEQRRREQGMAAPAAAPVRPKQDENGPVRSVMEQRNVQARQREAVRPSQAEADKENIQNMFDKKPKVQAAGKPERSVAEKAENDRLKNEMNRDMDQMELKLQAMKDKKDAENKQKRMAEERNREAANVAQQPKQGHKHNPQPPPQPQPNQQHQRHQLSQQERPSGAVPIKERHGLQPQPHGANAGPPQRSEPASQASSRVSSRMSSQEEKIRDRQHLIREQIQSRQQAQEAKGHRPPAVNIQENRMHQQLPDSQYTPASRFQDVRQSMQPPPGHMQHMFDSRASDPNFMPSVFTPHSNNPPPNKLQAIPSPAHWAGQPGAAFFDNGDGFTGDLITRQKELDRQMARQQISHDYDSEMQQFQMNMNRVNQAVSNSVHSRGHNVMAGQVGAKIAERDRALRMRQQAVQQRMRQQMGYGQPHHKVFGDVAYEGAMYSPKKVQWVNAPGNGFDDDDIEEEIGANFQRSINFDIEPIDEEMALYDNEEAELEREVAQRTLKIQMLKTAVFNDAQII